jgi:hypothetical protein
VEHKETQSWGVFLVIENRGSAERDEKIERREREERRERGDVSYLRGCVA